MAKAFNLKIVRSDTEMPDSEWWVARLSKGGWSILWSEDEMFGVDSGEMLTSLSKETDIIDCVINESVMSSTTGYWSQGDLKWLISHTSYDGIDKAPFHIEAHGDLPENFEAIKEEYFAKQNGDKEVDHLFEIPLEVAHSFTGFRHDSYLQGDDVDAFRILAPAG